MKIVHFEVDPKDQEFLKLEGHEAEFLPEILTAESAAKAQDAEVVTVFVNSVVNQAIIDTLPNVKLIVTRSTGFDHIDAAYAKTKGITVTNVPGYGSRTVAEFAFALMLDVIRKVNLAAEQVKSKNSWETAQFEGFNLFGKTLGVIGTGRIGMNSIQIGKGFGMEVIANDAFPNEAKATELGFRYAPLEEVLATSDVITLHVPAIPETHHLINTENVKKIKKGAVIVNTARGDVIDPEALIYGLNEKILAGVGLDVLEGEHELKEEVELLTKGHVAIETMKTLLEDHVLLDYPNVLITPHIAFNTLEARKEIIDTTLENITKFAAGEPQNIVKS